ncbi:MAG TPA: hypothetical protein VIY08_12670 [Candidatus Nitrosocosmicus sp.]
MITIKGHVYDYPVHLVEVTSIGSDTTISPVVQVRWSLHPNIYPLV